MKLMCAIFEVRDNADLSKVTIEFKDKANSNARIFRNVRAIEITPEMAEAIKNGGDDGR